MAKVKYNAPIENISGALAPGCVCRQKKMKVGKHVVLGPKEIYHKHKRDYHRHPLTEGEQQSCDRFRLAEAHRKQEMRAPERAAYWEARFLAQVQHPEPGNTKIYHRLDAFVRTMLMRAQD